MDDIIAGARLSAGAVYSYFKNKDDLIQAALTGSMAAARPQPMFESGDPPPPASLLADIAAAIEDFTRRDGFDLKRLPCSGGARSSATKS